MEEELGGELLRLTAALSTTPGKIVAVTSLETVGTAVRWPSS
jgi:hypothetical protein